MDVDLYLKRIGFDGSVDVSLECLFALQKAHMLNVPFENLDVYMGRPLSLDPCDLFDKIVTRRRGGYCFELNTLYGAVLREIGFNITPMLARVWLRDPAEVPPSNHMLHRVVIDGVHYTTDVGFGARTTRIPLDISQSTQIDDGDGYVRLSNSPYGHMLQRRTDEGWDNQFSFTQERAIQSDILVGNHFTETHPSSHFRHNRFIGRFTETGRNGLVDLNFTRRDGDQVIAKSLAGAEEWLAFIENEFGLVLDLTKTEQARLLNF
jgi:N-hydroxyarylamine O-acetyltransferase